jgi:AraC family transcriptional regulator
MQLYKPRNVVAGFHAQRPEADVPELTHIGEQWVPHDFSIPRHAHAAYEFYLQLDGWSEWKDAAGRVYRCNPGTFFAPPAGWEHWLHRNSRGKHHFLFACIDVDRVVNQRLPALQSVWRSRPVVYETAGHATEASFRQLVRQVTVSLPYRALALRAAIDALVIDASRLLVRPHASARLIPLHPAVEIAKQAMENHPSEPWKLADLSRLARVSSNHLVTLFSKELGVSPHEFLTQIRVARAKDLLRDTDATVTTVALELGFHSSQHFARVFRQCTGKTASRFRSTLSS